MLKKRSLLPALLLAAIPYLYLASIFTQLPAQVPTHFNLQGQADDWSHKNLLWILPAALPLLMIALMGLIPKLDSKRKLQEMGTKYGTLTLMLTLFFTLLSLLILYSAKDASIMKMPWLFLLIAGLLILLGNYFQTIRPNYFIGIRTPWTLENERVWRATHRMGGRLWMFGGVMVIVLALLFGNAQWFSWLFLITMLLLGVLPIVYSYVQYKQNA